jgi:EAL domain-containing protein (putative c-di-GMP-specific phosphodiesterase class I)
MHEFWLSWRGRVLWLGALALLLQQVPVSYLIALPGSDTPPAAASLVHLHAGVLLAIALLDRDRRVLLGCSLIVFAGWLVRAWWMDYSGGIYALGALNAIATYLWTLLCAFWMGWPRPAWDPRLKRDDLPRMLLIGLVLYPAGMVVSWWVINIVESAPGQWLNAVQILFAKHFGVAILTFPLVLAWTERRRPAERLSSRHLRWAMLFGLFLIASLWIGVSMRVLHPDAEGRSVVLMDYRFTLFAALAWCMLHLRPLFAMPLLSATLFALVYSLSGTAVSGATAFGFLNLLHLAVELNILLVAMLYFNVVDRDTRDLSAQLVAESRRDATTRLPNLNALSHRLLSVPPARCEIGCLVLDQADELVHGIGLASQTRLMNLVAGGMADLVEAYCIGTGQFALLPLQPDGDGAIWARVIARVEQLELENDRQPIRLLPYVGVAECLPDDQEAIDSALMRASHLAHEARRRNELHPLYASDDTTDIGGRLHEAAEALSCLRGERVVLHVQAIAPLCAIGAVVPGELHGEVLCRLRRSDGTLLMPDRFMRAIEGAGRGVELDLAVTRTLFAWLRTHPHEAARVGRLAINLTGQSLASSGFRAQLLEMLASSPLPLSRLCFEIIETAAISSPVETHAFLGALRARGCLIAVDDFGVGMQSFGRLKELPVDLIKIDGSFIRNVTQRGKDHAMVEATVVVARAFGAATVAEYVEDEATLHCLRELGVDWVQGYLVGRPVPIDEAFPREVATTR